MEPLPVMMRLERLTHEAKEAAEQGRWDIVGGCYGEREGLLAGASLDPQEAERLLNIDRQVQERALVAMAALKSLLQEASAVRRRLNGLRQRNSGQAADVRTILIEA